MDIKTRIGHRRSIDFDSSLREGVGVSGGLTTGAGPAFDRVMEIQSSAPGVRQPDNNNFFSRS